MTYVLLSIFCSVSVAVCLKLARKNQRVDILQMIAWNYPMAILLSVLFFKPDWSGLISNGAPWRLYLSLGLLLPSMFVVIAQAIHHAGIVRTEVAQRLSLFIPLAASFLLFQEQASATKIMGICLGILAILCSIKWQNSNERATGSSWLLLPLVFLGMGIIDILFKQVALFQGIAYTSSIFIVFVLAALLAHSYVVIGQVRGTSRFSAISIPWGLLMGLFNFGNILFYMMAHRAVANNPSIVFSSMNIGVIAVGALVGLIFFKEKLSWLNVLGITLAIASVLIITLF